MKKSLKKLLPTLALVVVTAALMGTSTFAWFTMNTKVEVNGMKVQIDTYDNLLIAPDTGTTNSNAESQFKNTIDLSSVAVAKLAPVSSVDGNNFYYILNKNATAAGDKYIGDYYPYTNTDETTKFTAQYGERVAYVDYNFQLKAINGSDVDDTVELRLTKLELKYDEGAFNKYVSPVRAFRYAIFMEEKASAYPDEGKTSGPHVTNFTDGHADAAEGSLKSIYAIEGAQNFTEGQAVGTGAALADVTYNAIASDAEFSTLANETVKYFKVTVRMWVEGEDTTCNNEAFVTLDENWTLNLAFDLVKSDDDTTLNVDHLTIDKTATIARDDDTLTAKLNATGITASSYKWYKDGVAIGGATTASYEVTTSGVYSCDITGSDSKVYPTAGHKMDMRSVSITQSNDKLTLTATTVDIDGEKTYQWYKGGAVIDGATNSTLTIEGTAFGVYKVTVNGEFEATYDYHGIHIEEFDGVSLGGDPPIMIGFTSGFTGSATYQWYKDEVADATTASIDITADDDGTKYYCVVVDEGITYYSETYTKQ